MRSAVKNVIFTFSLVASIAAQAISVGKVDFEKKSVTGVEVELASSKSNNVSVCGAHVGGLWSLTRNNVAGIQVGGLMTSADNLYGAQIGLMWAGAGDVFLNIVESNDVFGVQIGGYGCVAVGMSGVQIGSFGSLCWKEMNGVQIGGVLNCVEEKIRGGGANHRIVFQCSRYERNADKWRYVCSFCVERIADWGCQLH